MQVTVPFRGGAEDGLHALLFAAARTCAAESSGAVGLLALSCAARGDEPELSVEAEFAHREGRRVLGAIEARARVARLPASFDREALLGDALSHFGGTRVTSLCVTRGAEELFDVTVSFGSRVPFLAENLLLAAAASSAGDLAERARLLAELGVRTRARGHVLVAPRRQWRRPMSLAMQVRAFVAARAARADAAIYASTLPCTQSTLVAERDTRGASTALDVVLSRGLTPSYASTAADATEMQTLLEARLGARFVAREWVLTHTFGEAPTGAHEVHHRGLSWFQGGGRGARQR